MSAPADHPQDGSSLLLQAGRDVAILVGSSPRALCRIDEHGWLCLSGEASADLNMAAVLRSAPRSVLDDYVDEVKDLGLDAILMVDETAPHLVEAALARGLTSAGQAPVMVWSEASLPDRVASYAARRADDGDVPAVNAAIADAFSLAEAVVQRAMPPSILSTGADVWIVDAAETVAGSGTFIRSDDHVGIYCVATRPRLQRQGIGRAVLEGAMSYYLDHGVTTFTLEATAAGVRLYEQIGFTVAARPSVFVIGASTQFSTEGT